MNDAATMATVLGDWSEANRRHLGAEMTRLRLLLHRRVLWLRRHWAHEGPQDSMTWRISDAQADWLLNGSRDDEESVFYDTDADAIAVTASLRAVEAGIGAIGMEMRQAGAPAALDVLTQLFRLSRIERDVLVMALAPELDGSFERLYAYAQDDLTHRFATPQLAAALLEAAGNDDRDVRDCFLPDATLRRLRLLTVDETTSAPFPSRALRTDERILNFALGVNRMDPGLASTLTPVTQGPISSADRERVGRIASWAQAGKPQLFSRAVNLIDPEHVEPLYLARAACDALGVTLCQLHPADLPAQRSERRERLALIEREAVLLQMAVYVDLDAMRAEDRGDLVQDIDRLRAFVIARRATRWPGMRETLAVSVGKPNAAEQAELWQQAFGATAAVSSDDVDSLVEQFDLSPGQIWRAASAAAESATLRSEPAPTADDVWRACEQEASPKLDELAKRIAPAYGWDDIVLPPEPFRQLYEIAAQVIHRAKVYRDWGFGEKLARGRGITALFAGPSGTGKTMAAEVLARDLRLDLYRIDLAGVVSKYIGETERNLKRIFAAAERGGAILFFDEADALFGKRSEVKDSHDRYANIEVNYLLQSMEDFRGLAILATNRKSSLDSAFVRRLRFIIDFPFPDAAHRKRIWRSVFPPQADLHGIDFAWLARLEIPGGHIRNIAVAAAFLAASEGAPIGMIHVMRAARREYGKMERLIQEADFGPYYAAVTP